VTRVDACYCDYWMKVTSCCILMGKHKMERSVVVDIEMRFVRVEVDVFSFGQDLEVLVSLMMLFSLQVIVGRALLGDDGRSSVRGNAESWNSNRQMRFD